MIGQRLGPYEVVAKLGEGGMGEVYRARDERLGRDVALKILPELFAADPDRLARFDREARALAALNHPHIAQIYDRVSAVVETDGSGAAAGRTVHALVMELVEGEDLAERLARGPMTLGEAREAARQLAEALEAAHEQGIVHRDLKPANIKLKGSRGPTPARRSGEHPAATRSAPDLADLTIKVLDFGLARAADTAAVGPEISPAIATMTSPVMTQHGIILGSAAYMAPEQAAGRSVDKRADIWAFGVVVYEMLTGRSLFAAGSIAETLARVIERTPDLSTLPAGTPPLIRRLLVRCLERDPRRRLRDIGEARIALADLASGVPEGAPAAAPLPSGLRRLAWPAAALALAAAAAIAAWQMRAPDRPAVRRFVIPTPGDAPASAAAISPDGSRIAFVAADKVWVQPLDAFTPVEVPSSSGAHAVFWSPDGTALGFQARGQLWKVVSGGAAPVAIGRVPQEFTVAGGASWLEDGRIVFTTGGTGLLEIDAGGGEPRPLLEIDPAKEADFHNVAAMPDGRAFVFVTHPSRPGGFPMELYVPADASRRVILPPGLLARPVFSPSGHLLFEQNGGVWAMPFSTTRLVPEGEATLVAAAAREPSVARDGTLVMLPGTGGATDTRLFWVDRRAQPSEALPGSEASVQHPQISPDGRFVVASVGLGSESAIWIFDLARGTERRLTFESGANVQPSWSPDGVHVLYLCGSAVCARRADGGGGRVEIVGEALTAGAAEVTPDGRRLVFVRESPPGNPDIWAVDISATGLSQPATATPQVAVAGGRAQRLIDISPDGRFVAYSSSEEGTFAIYVSGLNGDGKWQISRGYGAWPRWGAKGDRLYYVDELQRIVEVEVDLRSTFTPGPVVSRVDANISGGSGYDVAADGSRFLVPRSATSPARQGSLLVVQHWAAGR